MSIRKIQLKNISQVNMVNQEFEEIEKLEKLINDSLVQIQSLQEELKALERGLRHFFEHYYGSADNDNSTSKDADLEQDKQNIYNQIAKVCSQESLQFDDHNAHDSLLKIEGYLNEGTEQSQSPYDLLSDLTSEYHNFIEQMSKLKNKKQNLLDHPTSAIKQEVIWSNIKTSETISKIREDITNQVNRPS